MHDGCISDLHSQYWCCCSRTFSFTRDFIMQNLTPNLSARVCARLETLPTRYASVRPHKQFQSLPASVHDQLNNPEHYTGGKRLDFGSVQPWFLGGVLFGWRAPRQDFSQCRAWRCIFPRCLSKMDVNNTRCFESCCALFVSSPDSTQFIFISKTWNALQQMQRKPQKLMFS